ncbi:amino acid permease [Gluconacetobacter aggeris]|uniref:Amino acid permease n=1 Tax=Gluconacetobacter aggeris TaxID=1286186 RepID=A0A7W4IT74_9PROT|nr:amino acid permease [Gluconacetobacter aggeris]MBB2168574.1 amino acid permease [Gluconacetobacter aggeris]
MLNPTPIDDSQPDAAPANGGGLAHSLRTRHVSMIAIGGMVGAGLFVNTSVMIQGAGPLVLLSYLMAGMIVFLVMRMLGEMAIECPEAGSFVGHVRRGLGHRAAFVTGWSYWLFWVVVASVEAKAAALIVAPMLGVAQLPVALALIGLMTAVNMGSVRGYGEFEFWFSLMKITAIGVFTVIAALALFGVIGSSLHGGIAHLWDQGGFMPHGFGASLSLLPAILFTFAGAEIATVAAAETDNPGYNTMQAIRTVVVRVMLFYMGSLGVILCLIPWNQIRSGHSPFLDVLHRIGIPGAEAAMTVVVLVAIASCLNSTLYVTSRILFEMAAHGDAPAVLVRTGSSGAPRRAIAIGSLVAVVLTVIAATFPGEVFGFLLNASGAIILFDYLMVVFAQIALRRRMHGEGRQPAFPMLLFPYLSWLTVGAILLVMVTMLLTPDTRVQIELGSLTLILIVALGAVAPRRGGRAPS